jgi:hypothetical protein
MLFFSICVKKTIQNYLLLSYDVAACCLLVAGYGKYLGYIQKLTSQAIK